MEAYPRNGARLVDPKDQVVEVYRPDRAVERHPGARAVALDPELSGFALETALLFEG